MLPPCDVIVDDEPLSGRRNMAVDAALLEHGRQSAHSVVRIYRWDAATVSLGYFQKSSAEIPQSFARLPLVTRLSGGGAILHHHEITYSCVLPAHHPARKDPSSLYRTAHSAIIACLAEQGVTCWMRADLPAGLALNSDTHARASNQPFLCFLRSDPNDVVMPSGDKVIGSAQRRRRGITLQHGSILMQASSHATSLPGLCDFAPDFDEQLFLARLPDAIAAAIGSRGRRRELTSAESSTADRLQRSHAAQSVTHSPRR
jgi:lipoate-protein ligase A